MLLEVTKFVVGGAVASCVSFTIKQSMKVLVDPENFTKTGKIALRVGGTAVGLLAAKAASEYTEELIQDGVNVINKVKTSLKNRLQKEEA
jgi:hypothetical protein